MFTDDQETQSIGMRNVNSQRLARLQGRSCAAGSLWRESLFGNVPALDRQWIERMTCQKETYDAEASPSGV